MNDMPPAGLPPDPVESETRSWKVWAGVVAALVIAAAVVAIFLATRHNSPGPAGPTPTPSNTPSPSPAVSPTPTAPATPAGGAGMVTDSSFTGCPATAPGQHTLAAVTGPTAAGATADPHNEWYGCGSVLMPADYPVFTGDNWEMALSFSCPDSDGPGMADGMTVESWVYEGGGTPVHNAANDVSAELPWSDDVHSTVPQAGNYRLKTVLQNGAAGDNRCRWHIRAYATPAS